MMGLAKLLCSKRRDRAAPNAQLTTLAGHVGTSLMRSRSKCALPTQQTAAVACRDGMVSSFGLGGTIASAVLRVEALVGQQQQHGRELAYHRRSFPWRRPLRVHVAWRGAISGMVLCEQPAFGSALEHTEVELQVQAVGLNFRDVLLVLGEYPGPPEPPGSDCSGIVTAQGDGSCRGGNLFGMAPGCLSSFVRARTTMQLMVRRPVAVSAQEACTLPATWTTVREMLHRACLRGQQAVRLHAATGGVGLVAVEHSGWLGIHIRATAGQPHKHQLIRALGVVSSSSSRRGGARTRSSRATAARPPRNARTGESGARARRRATAAQTSS